MLKTNRTSLFTFLLVLILLTASQICAAQEYATREKLWEIQLGQSADCSPAIATDGTIYATVSGWTNYADISGGKLLAVTPAGTVKWKFETPSEIQCSPAIGADGTIYFGCRDKKLYAIAPDGKEKWNFKTGFWVDSSPAIGADGTIYFGSWDGNFYAVTPEGKLRWMFTNSAPIDSSPAIDSAGVIYFGSHDKNFYALEPDGKLKWKNTTGGTIISSPAIGADGSIYITSTDGKIYIFDQEGKTKKEIWTGGVHRSSPVLDENGLILLGGSNVFCCYSADGTKKWDFGYPVVEGCGTISANGSVFFMASINGVGTVLEFGVEDGQRRSTSPLFGSANSSVTLAPDGTIYAGGWKLHSLKGIAGLEKSAWPKFHRNLRQTGRVGDD